MAPSTTKIKLILLLSILNTLSLLAQNYQIDTLRINSSILNEVREILFFEPANMHRTDSVKVIYLLNDKFANYRYAELLRENKDLPIIGISIINTDRRRDMLPINQADKFLEFMARELIPKIETDFIIKERILYGHSFDGAFTLYSMINKPGLFNRYIASSPTPIMNLVDPSIFESLNTSLEKEIKFYFSYGSKDMKQVRKWGKKLYENLGQLQLDRICWKHEIFEGENHNTSDVISLKKGIAY